MAKKKILGILKRIFGKLKFRIYFIDPIQI